MPETLTVKRRSPWAWVPTTFFMEGFPGIMIMIVTSIMYKNLGVSNERITFYTGMLMLPWVIKPVWASIVDIIKTKRWWIYSMELCGAAGVVALAFSLQTPVFFVLSIAICWVIALFSSSHDIATDGFYIMQLKSEEQSFFLGFQSASYQVGKITAQGLLVMLSGYLFSKINNYFIVWSIVMLIAALIIFSAGIYHKFILPRNEQVRDTLNIKETLKELFGVYKEFFKLKELAIGILFLIFYKVGEFMILNMLPLFLLDPLSKGGLGLNNQFTGFVYGVTAPLALLLGGLFGGFAIHKKGFKFWIWWMLLVMNIPHSLYIILAYFQIQNKLIVLSFITIEQFCFSFGYSAYLIFLMYLVKNSRFKTAHYSFLSGIMLLAIMGPKMLSGWVQTQIGYTSFFIIVLLLCIPAAIAIKFLRVDPLFGRKNIVIKN